MLHKPNGSKDIIGEKIERKIMYLKNAFVLVMKKWITRKQAECTKTANIEKRKKVEQRFFFSCSPPPANSLSFLVLNN